MIVKSFGCSFIYGTDLADDGRGFPYATPSNLTWPSLVAKQLDSSYNCYARPGAGNFQILEKVLIHAACNDPALFIIGWTWTERFDYFIENTDKWHHPWKTIMPVDQDDIAKFYYKNLHSEYTDKLNSLINIKTAIDILKDKKCQFIMTYMDDLLFADKWHATPAVTDLQNYIKPYLTRFENKNFVDWSKSYGYQISDTLHPLEDAHRAAANLVTDNLQYYIKN